jgi:hypothetical protein
MDINNPILVDYIGTPGVANQLFLRDSLIFLADGAAGLTILNTQSSNLYNNQPPGSFSLLMPINGDTLNDPNPTFRWEKAVDPNPEDVIRYKLSLDTSVEFNHPITIADISGTSFVLGDSLSNETMYYWTVMAMDQDNYTTASTNIFNFWVQYETTGMSSGDNIDLPHQFSLKQNYPNPFNPKTKIDYTLPKYSYVSIKVFNSLGERVSTLVDKVQQAGYYSVHWNATEQASGIYFVCLKSSEYSKVIKMILLR